MEEHGQLKRAFIDATAGAISGAISRTVTSPLDVIKIRFQVQLEPTTQWALIRKSSYNQSKYTGMLQATKDIFREEGFLGFWRGNVPALLMVMPYTAIQFTVLHKLKSFVSGSSRSEDHINISPYLSYVSGSLSGCAAAVGSYPLSVQCGAKGPRPRYPRVWKAKRKIGTISKSLKLVESIKELSNVKEEVYGTLDSFIAWELEFPLITVKKALKTLEDEKEWKRVIQVTKWMLSKGQGRTMGSYYTLLNALAEDGRIDEAEELWRTLLSQNMESLPRMFFDRMIAIYYHLEMHNKMFEIFADMEELGVRPTVSIVSMVGDVFEKLGMSDKYKKLNKKYPPPKWEYRYFKGKRVKVRIKYENGNGNVKNDDASDGEEGSGGDCGSYDTDDGVVSSGEEEGGSAPED